MPTENFDWPAPLAGKDFDSCSAGAGESHRKARGRRHKSSFSSAASPVPLFQPFEQPNPLYKPVASPPPQPIASTSTYSARQAEKDAAWQRAAEEMVIRECRPPELGASEHKLSAEVHKMVDELIRQPWDRVSTSEAFGAYLDALCRRERRCALEMLRADDYLRSVRQIIESDGLRSPEDRVFETDYEADYRRDAREERDHVFDRAVHIFRHIQRKEPEGLLVPNRYLGSFLETLGLRGEVMLAEQVMQYIDRPQSRAPLTFHVAIAHAHAKRGNVKGAQAQQERLNNAIREFEEEHGELKSTLKIAWNSHLFELLGGYSVIEDLRTIGHLRADIDASVMQAAFRANDVAVVEATFAPYLEGNLASTHALVKQYIEGHLLRDPEAGVQRAEQLGKLPHFSHRFESGEVHRLVLRTLARESLHAPDALFKAYMLNVQEAKGQGFWHSASELVLVLNKLIAAALPGDVSNERGNELLGMAMTAWRLSKEEEQAGRFGRLNSGPDVDWYRLPIDTIRRFSQALALFGRYDDGLELMREIVDSCPKDARHASGLVPDSEEKLSWAVALAIGSQVIGSRPTLEQILDCWEIQRKIVGARAYTRWKGQALKYWNKVSGSLSPKYAELLKSLRSAKEHYPLFRHLPRSRASGVAVDNDDAVWEPTEESTVDEAPHKTFARISLPAVELPGEALRPPLKEHFTSRSDFHRSLEAVSNGMKGLPPRPRAIDEPAGEALTPAAEKAIGETSRVPKKPRREDFGANLAAYEAACEEYHRLLPTLLSNVEVKAIEPVVEPSSSVTQYPVMTKEERQLREIKKLEAKAEHPYFVPFRYPHEPKAEYMARLLACKDPLVAEPDTKKRERALNRLAVNLIQIGERKVARAMWDDVNRAADPKQRPDAPPVAAGKGEKVVKAPSAPAPAPVVERTVESAVKAVVAKPSPVAAEPQPVLEAVPPRPPPAAAIQPTAETEEKPLTPEMHVEEALRHARGLQRHTSALLAEIDRLNAELKSRDELIQQLVDGQKKAFAYLNIVNEATKSTK